METLRATQSRKQSAARLLAGLPARTPIAEACLGYLADFREGKLNLAELEKLCLTVAPETGDLGAWQREFDAKMGLMRVELSKKEPNQLVCGELQHKLEACLAKIHAITFWRRREVALGLRVAA